MSEELSVCPTCGQPFEDIYCEGYCSECMESFEQHEEGSEYGSDLKPFQLREECYIPAWMKQFERREECYVPSSHYRGRS